MIRYLPLLAALVTAAPAAADEPPYYGPGKPWHGIGYKFGYEDKVEKDGSWRIEARVQRGEPLDLAMYRAAERAHEAGFRYVQFLRGTVQVIGFGLARLALRGAPNGLATVWVRPAATADAPTGCKAAKAGGCYTADVAQVMRVLGGPGGTQPGVAIVDHHDKFGRPVILSGFGIGAADGRGTTFERTLDGRVEIRRTGAFVTTAAASAVPAYTTVPPRPVAPFATPTFVAPQTVVSASTAADEAQARFDAAQRSQHGVRGRNASQGWTISD